MSMEMNGDSKSATDNMGPPTSKSESVMAENSCERKAFGVSSTDSNSTGVLITNGSSDSHEDMQM